MNRIEFLKSNYNVRQLNNDLKPNEPFNYYLLERKNGHDTVLLDESVLDKLIDCDPTKNNMYSQWLVEVALHKIKDNTHTNDFANTTFCRFINEDLEKSKECLELFHNNKRKKLFKNLASKNHGLMGIIDPTNINQYTDIEQLYAATFPFKERADISEIEAQLEHMVSLGEAEMPVNDGEWTVFVPLSNAASELFSFTNWCTAKKGNSMFKHYTQQKRPGGDDSKLYIFINNDFFRGESEEVYQIHFESSQFMDKNDRSISDTFKDIILKKNLSVRNYMRKELGELIKLGYLADGNNEKGLFFDSTGKNYVKYALQFGYGDLLFDSMDETIPAIAFTDLSIEKVPSLKKFNNIRTLYLDNIGLADLDKDMLWSQELRVVSVPRNKITSIPKEISRLKNLIFINIKGNPITEIPDEIKYLDPTNGGKLERISIDNDSAIKERLQKLLPSVIF